MLETIETDELQVKKFGTQAESTDTKRQLYHYLYLIFAHQPMPPSLIKIMWAKARALLFCRTECLLVPHFLDVKKKKKKEQIIDQNQKEVQKQTHTYSYLIYDRGNTAVNKEQSSRQSAGSTSYPSVGKNTLILLHTLFKNNSR